MGWWPFRRGDKQQESLLDKDLQQYYDDVVMRGQHADADAPRAPRTAEPAEPSAPANARIRPTTAAASSQKTVKQIAMDNCVEFEKAYSTCLVQGTYFQRFGGCPTQLTMYEQCQTMQQDALTVLGFARAQTDTERLAIKAQADDLMIRTAPSLTITDAQADAFTKALRDLAPN